MRQGEPGTIGCSVTCIQQEEAPVSNGADVTEDGDPLPSDDEKRSMAKEFEQKFVEMFTGFVVDPEYVVEQMERFTEIHLDFSAWDHNVVCFVEENDMKDVEVWFDPDDDAQAFLTTRDVCSTFRYFIVLWCFAGLS